MPTASLGAIVPAVPFPSPVAPPTGFGVSRLAFTIDAVWLPYLIGCAKVLTANSTFDPPDPNPAVLAVQKAYSLLDDLMAAVPVVAPSDTPGGCGCDCEDCMQLRFNGCTLQGFDCLTQAWVDIPQVGSCVANPSPGGGITPPAGQKCQEYNITFNADALTILPFLVNTGDTLAITTLVGAGNDGTLNWYCINGQYFIGGTCSGGEFTLSTDPIPTANHMSCVLKIGSNYYPFTSGTFTVPSGVVNQQIFIGVNDAPISDDTGTYAIDFVYCNNQAAPVVSWCYDIDFTASPQGFTALAMSDGSGGFTPLATWVPGTGWKAVSKNSSGSFYQYGFLIVFDMGPTSVVLPWTTEVIGHTASSVGSGSSTVTIGQITAADISALYGTFVNTATLTANAAYDKTQNLTGTPHRFLYVVAQDYGIVGAPSPEFSLSSLKLSGNGFNPFGSSNC